MATKADKKTGGAKTSRSEIVTVRLDPEMRYLAELAARFQRRTLSSYIEWAIEESFKSAGAMIDTEGDAVPVNASRGTLWDTNEVDRFIRLAKWAPHLLTHDEQELWKLILEVWTLASPPSETPITHLFTIKETEVLRRHWALFKQSAAEAVPASEVLELIQRADKS